MLEPAADNNEKLHEERVGSTADVSYDVFISHAHEDALSVAEPLAKILQDNNVRVWLDRFELTLGDNLRRTLDLGLAQSRFGIVILSPHFFEKEWALRELDALLARERRDRKVILPVWHQLDYDAIVDRAPTIADRIAVTTQHGLEAVAREVLRAIGSHAAPGGFKSESQMPPSLLGPVIHEEFEERRRGRILERAFKWEPQRTLLHAAIDRTEAEAAHNLLELSIAKLSANEYSQHVIDSFRVIFVELSRNAFEHGCGGDTDVIRFVVEIDIGYVRLAVFNPPNIPLEIQSRIRRARRSLAGNEMRQRGRGLLLVADTADAMSSTPGHTGVRIVLYREPVILDVEVVEGVTVISAAGALNPSFNRRLLRIARQHTDSNLLIDFSSGPPKVGTAPITVIIQVAALYKRFGRKVVVVASRDTGAYLPGSLRASSRAEAIQVLRAP